MKVKIYPGNRQLEVITGPMYSEKTEEFLGRMDTYARINNYPAVTIRPVIDNRTQKLTSHGHKVYIGDEFKIPVDGLTQLQSIIKEKEPLVIGFDEVQFFKQNIADYIVYLSELGYIIVANGLNTDFRGCPFGCVPFLMSQASSLDTYYATCTFTNAEGIQCNNPATMTQRLDSGGKPVKCTDPINLIGGKDLYQSRCSDHHVILDENGSRIFMVNENVTFPWRERKKVKY